MHQNACKFDLQKKISGSTRWQKNCVSARAYIKENPHKGPPQRDPANQPTTNSSLISSLGQSLRETVGYPSFALSASNGTGSTSGARRRHWGNAAPAALHKHIRTLAHIQCSHIEPSLTDGVRRAVRLPLGEPYKKAITWSQAVAPGLCDSR